MTALGIALGTLVGMGISYGWHAVRSAKKKKEVHSQATKIVSQAKHEASRIKQRAQEQGQQVRRSTQKEIERVKEEGRREQRRYQEKERTMRQKVETQKRDLDHRESQIKAEKHKIEVVEQRLQDQKREIQQRIEDLTAQLETVSGMTKEEAKREIIEAVTAEATLEATRKAVVIENEAKEEAEKKAKKVLSMAINRYAGEYTTERTTTVIPLPDNDMKGLIIGREGRNIRALEAACGVDLIVDDTPELVVISGFDPVRREVARKSLERLMKDRRVHPARIEELVEKSKSEIFKGIKQDGEKALLEVGLVGLNSEIVKLIGSLKYRTSYTQNNYSHSLEVAFMCGMMAAEMGLDVKLARRAGLLHDIGKALDHSIDGSHAIIGAEFAKRHGENEIICHAIRAHHEDEKPKTALAYLVAAADAISSARPGARLQMMETYVQRLEDLESIGNSFDGVVRTFAIQAGREVRVMVEGSKINDEQSVMLSRDIARKIEKDMNFPGQIKVTVVRETRAIDYAR